MSEENHTSDSDQSDEDFCPDKLKHCDDSVSEEEEEVDSDALSDLDVKKVAKPKHLNSKKKSITKSKRVNNDSDSDEEKDGKYISAPNRNSRVQTRTASNISPASCPEKDQIESDDDDKVRTDSLWSSFLSDVKPANAEKTNKSETTRTRGKVIKKADTGLVAEVSAKKPIFESNVKAETVTTAIIEDVKCSAKEDQSIIAGNTDNSKVCKTPIGIKRPASIGGLGSILGSIEKKKKDSVLEKSKLDWMSYKKDEGLDEELQTHNKGKDGYLERMDFLQRTDLRQFEIEKKMRVSRRSK